MFQKKSFTLIELLVVIAIIAILVSVVVVSMAYSRQKGRDAKKTSDIVEIAAALQSYYADNNSYPNFTASNPISSKETYAQMIDVLIGGNYLDKCPQDPIAKLKSNYITGSTHCYDYDERTTRASVGYRYSGSNNNYALAVGLEVVTEHTQPDTYDPPGNSTPPQTWNDYKIENGDIKY